MHCLEREYLRLFFKLQKLQWENYAYNAGHDLNSTNQAIFGLLNKGEATNFRGRKASIWKALLNKGLVENHPQVSALRNRLDDWGNYAAAVPASGCQARRTRLAINMRPDVLKLLALRQGLAQKQGFASYMDLVLAGEDLSLEIVESLTRQYLRENLNIARRLIKEHNITWPTWFQDLNRLASKHTLGHPCKEELVDALLEQMGLWPLRKYLTIVYKKEGFTGYTGVLQPGQDVRILLDRNTGLRSLLTLGHELGHALCHLANKNRGLYLTWTSSFDESMAVIMEHIAAHLWLKPVQQRKAQAMWTLEGVRCSLSFLFELDLWRDPQGAETYYANRYGQLGLNLGDPAQWTLDSFRSLDPVYIHNYVLGEVVARRILAHLKGQFNYDYRAWGAWLLENFWACGREKPLTGPGPAPIILNNIIFS